MENINISKSVSRITYNKQADLCVSIVPNPSKQESPKRLIHLSEQRNITKQRKGKKFVNGKYV